MRINKQQRELIQRVNIFIMSYIYFEQMTKHWGEKWTPQRREGWMNCVMRITKDLSGWEHFREMPSLRELKMVMDHYSYDPYEIRCTKCSLRSMRDPRENPKKWLKENVGQPCGWCKKGKRVQVKPHHCKICDKIALRKKEEAKKIGTG